jgi:hypothetical protein
MISTAKVATRRVAAAVFPSAATSKAERGRHDRAGDGDRRESDHAAMNPHAEHDHRKRKRDEQRQERDDRAACTASGEESEPRQRRAAKALPDPKLALDQDAHGELDGREQQELDPHAGKRMRVAVVLGVGASR